MQIIDKIKIKKLFLSLELTSTKFKKPEYAIFINGAKSDIAPEVVVESHEKEIHTYSFDYNELTSFSINFLNKLGRDTLVIDGKIVGDVNIVVKKIIVEGIDFTSKIDTVFEYNDTQGNKHKTSGFMHVSGSLEMLVKKNVLYTDWISSFE